MDRLKKRLPQDINTAAKETAAEARDDAAPHLRQSATAAAQGAPVITVKQPDISRALRNPMTFDIQFRATPGTGWLFCITDAA